MSRIGGHGIAIGGSCDFQQSVKLVCRRISGNKQNAETVDHGLYHQSAEGGNHILQAQRKPKAKLLHNQLPVCPTVLPPYVKAGNPADSGQTANTGKHLCQNGGNRRSGNSHSQNQHEQKIQHDIADGRHRHRPERCPAVPHSPQDGRRGIIKQRCRNARINKTQVQKGHSTDFLRGSHPRKHSRKRCLSKPGKQNGSDNREESGLKHRPAKLSFLSGSEFLGNDYRKALSQSLHGAEHQKGQPFRRSQCRQRVHAERLPHHQRIHKSIQLLKHISQHEGKGEAQNQSARLSLCHLHGPGTIFLFHHFPILSPPRRCHRRAFLYCHFIRAQIPPIPLQCRAFWYSAASVHICPAPEARRPYHAPRSFRRCR